MGVAPLADGPTTPAATQTDCSECDGKGKLPGLLWGKNDCSKCDGTGKSATMNDQPATTSTWYQTVYDNCVIKPWSYLEDKARGTFIETAVNYTMGTSHKETDETQAKETNDTPAKETVLGVGGTSTASAVLARRRLQNRPKSHVVVLERLSEEIRESKRNCK